MSRYDDSDALLRLPRPLRRLGRLADRLCEGHTVVWFLPQNAPVHQLITTLEELCRGRVQFGSAYVPHSVTWPEKWLMEQYGVRGDPWSDEAAELLLRSADLPDVLILWNLDRLSSDQLQSWRRFLEDWARINRRPHCAPGERKAFLVPVLDYRAVVLLKEIEDPLLDKVWYWGWITSREVRVVALEHLNDTNQYGSAALWGEAVWASLAGSDLDCFLWIAERMEYGRPLGELLVGLREYGETRGFLSLLPLLEDGATRIGSANGANFGVEELEPAPWLQPLWCAGGLDWHDDGGWGLHSALLSIAGRQEPLLHRVWRGQTAVLLPKIDQCRIALSRQLAADYTSWPEYLRQAEAAASREEDVSPELAAEFRHMLEFLYRQGDTASLRERRRDVDTLRRIRNTLAHYQPIEWPQFQQVCEQYWKLVRTEL